MKRKLALASWVVAVILSAVALLLPPTGYIDYSVLLLVAQFLLLCATFLGVDSYVNLIKRPSRPPHMRSGWLFDEVDVAVNTEECGT